MNNLNKEEYTNWINNLRDFIPWGDYLKLISFRDQLRYEKNPKLCKNCKNPLSYKNKKSKFCNKSCAASFNNLGKRRHGYKPSNCLVCGKKLKCSQSKFCSKKCWIEHKNEINIKEWLNGNSIGYCYTTGKIMPFIRNYLFKINNNKCQECGWSEKNPVTGKIPLHVEHCDGNWKNNKLENLKLLCPNCHSLTSTFGILNKGRGRRSYIKNNASVIQR